LYAIGAGRESVAKICYPSRGSSRDGLVEVGDRRGKVERS
jgi:hypothetical protein